MYEGQIVFSQLMNFLPEYQFQKCVVRYQGNNRIRSRFFSWSKNLPGQFRKGLRYQYNEENKNKPGQMLVCFKFNFIPGQLLPIGCYLCFIHTNALLFVNILTC